MLNNSIPIFIVSLKGSERRILLIDKLKDMSYQFVDAINGVDFLDEIRKINEQKKQSNSPKIFTPGEYGCARSHRKIYEKMESENINWAIILEDDVDFDFDFQSQISEIIDSFNENNLYILGCQEGLPSSDHIVISKKNNIKFKGLNLNKTIRSERYIYRTAAYLISKKTASKILEFTENNFSLADDWYVFSKEKLFENIYLGDFIRHPELLEGQSTIENERLMRSKRKSFKSSQLFKLLRSFKVYFRQYIIKAAFDK